MVSLVALAYQNLSRTHAGFKNCHGLSELITGPLWSQELPRLIRTDCELIMVSAIAMAYQNLLLTHYGLKNYHGLSERIITDSLWSPNLPWLIGNYLRTNYGLKKCHGLSEHITESL